MKYRLAKPFLFLIAFILIVGLACSVQLTDDPEPEVEPEGPSAPAEEVASPVPPPPTDIPAPVAQEFYTEEFSGDTSMWTYFLIDANQATPIFVEEDFGTMYVGTEDERLVFNLESEGQWPYATYNAFEYEDVRIDVVAENRGVNNNNVSLICRHTDAGWYEFNIANNGLYWVYYAEMLDNGKIVYHELNNGGSNKIKMGKEQNEYSIICQGTNLSLYINGNETKSFSESRFAIRSGKIGVGVASFATLPVNVEIHSVTISQP